MRVEMREMRVHMREMRVRGEGDEGGDAGDESVCEGDGVQVSGSSGKIDHLLMDAHPSISAGISVIPDLLDV